jgi:hypothetical protein
MAKHKEPKVRIAIPAELEATRTAALRAIGSIKPAAPKAFSNLLFHAERTESGRQLPDYFLIYFLLVDLLGFRNLGESEKVAWSVPIEYKGVVFFVEHRKFGIGLFAPQSAAKELLAKEVVTRIRKAVSAAIPFFEWMAETAVQSSKVNVHNKSGELFRRFEFLLNLYNEKEVEAKVRKDERCTETREDVNGYVHTQTSSPAFVLKIHAGWLGMAAIEAFFSWTEHVFIHIAILCGKLTTGVQVADAAALEWQSKFKLALDVNEKQTKLFFDRMVVIRRQMRNFVAHGSFGKEREAFAFHSGAGAAPVFLPHKAGKVKYALGKDVIINEANALKVLGDFVQYLWAGGLEPAKHYIQESGLPVNLAMASDGTYARAMSSVASMNRLIDLMHYESDRAANMDW